MDGRDAVLRPWPANSAAEFVDKLNEVYNLGLYVPDLSLSPVKRKAALITEEEKLAELIHLRIRHVSSRCPWELTGIELKFRDAAKSLCSHWISKPRAASNHLLTTDSPPRASTQEQRRQLRECLLELLPYGPALSFTHHKEDAQGPGYHKRPSDITRFEPAADRAMRDSPSSKKAKSALDRVPVRTVTSPSPEPDERTSIQANRSFQFNNRLMATHPPPNHSFSGAPMVAVHSSGLQEQRTWNQESANTSVTTRLGEAIFSFPPPPGSVSSQETVPNDDREEYKNANLPVDTGFDRPRTPTASGRAEPAVLRGTGASWHSQMAEITSSEEALMMNLSPTTGGQWYVKTDGYIQGEPSDDLQLDDAPPRNLFGGISHGPSESAVPVRQRNLNSSDWPTPGTSTAASLADLDDRLPISLANRLRNSWPKLPKCLINAPFPVIWEVTRAAVCCDVRLDTLLIEYDPSWRDPTKFHNALKTHPDFRDKTLPDRCDGRAWKAAFSTFQYRGLSVTMVIEANYNPGKDSALYSLTLQPLKLESSHRLARRFGADRVLEITFPSPKDRGRPEVLKRPGVVEDLIDRLSQSQPILLGRIWGAFFTKDDKKIEKKYDSPGVMETETHRQKRIYFFAVDGNDFKPGITGALPPKEEATNIHSRTKMKIHDLLEWTTSISSNGQQPALKLFSRLALVLSRTTPTIVLEKNQIRQHSRDLLSPTGNVMNDGIGRMSPTLAKRISDRLGIDDRERPSGFQGRIGPYKGFWVVDSLDDGELWIEGYPSQKKWNCDLEDPDHRTFEVRKPAGRLIPASLNEQFIPVLEDRARDPLRMRAVVSRLLEETVNKDLEEQALAAQDPIALHAWASKSSSAARKEKIATGLIPFLGGLPKSEEETLKHLLDAGFTPRLKFLQEIAANLAKQGCDKHKAKIKVTVPRSTYAFMAVDFAGILEEGEVHLGFSGGSECDTRTPAGPFSSHLLGQDVLVARAPAHFPSDMQKVKAVYKLELSHLRDVIVFSIKGNEPLADLLSGGDYDGDLAWVCWDPDIVNNFENAPVPVKRDLFKKHKNDMGGYLEKDKTTYQDILQKWGNNRETAASKFLKDSFDFNLLPNLLGICTRYKERVCYKTGSVSDEKAIILSTLVSHLVDQIKQGIIFTDDEWARLRKDLIKPPVVRGEENAYNEPAYKGEKCPANPEHILDWLKFKVAIPTIQEGLNTFLKDISGGDEATDWDEDLAYYFHDLEERANDSESYKTLRRDLQVDLYAVVKVWDDVPHGSYQNKVETAYQAWLDVRPSEKALRKRDVKYLVLGPHGDSDYWGLLKASVMFKLFHKKHPKIVWMVAGEHLANIKARQVSGRMGRRPAVAVVHEMYVAHRMDKGMVKALTATDEAAGYEESVADGLEGRGFDYFDGMMDDDE
ncbi:related to qde-1 RNA-dependent RNA polymerase (RdRP) [Cephalotrichum gorgonifer]|uniref:RNA-dependent RNA polymerase n=1 Tax=Cephalotrichum gorgonifer TaxID=2041049 RepID=A0AAE8MRM6_9PEZI|nr:related to qde-1 RNA-dependent RNA polymerase (RdRP) [Cephalotrichum gorgonifer]